jgi:hypothetical protein
MRISSIFQDEYDKWEQRAADTYSTIAKELTGYPMAVGYSVAGLMDYQRGYRTVRCGTSLDARLTDQQFYLTGQASDPLFISMRRLVDGTFPPNRTTIHIAPDALPQGLALANSTVRDIIAHDDLAVPSVRVCEARTCGPRMISLQEVRKYVFDLP